MKKYCKILPILLIITILCTSSGFVGYANNPTSEEEFVVYVSPDGDDSGDGTPENMLRTPAGAQAFVRNSGVLRKRPVRVIFKPGNYYIDKQLGFNETDEGTERCPVVWEAETKGTAHFYGTTVLDNSLFELVTDQAILDRLPTAARGKVVQMDLKKMNIDIETIAPHTFAKESTEKPFTNLFANGKEQMLSRWPNGEFQYAFWDKVVYKGSTASCVYTENDGGIIQFSDPRLSKWVTAKHAYIRGHTGSTYSCESYGVKEVDPEKGTIRFNTTGYYPLNNSSPRELQIFNLLEEIDCATEWYIDTDTDMLYYYPPKEITPDDEFELSTLNENMFGFSGDLHMTLKGLDLSRMRKRVATISATNLTIDGCVITYSKARFAFYATSDNYTFINNYIAHCDGTVLYSSGGNSLVNDRTSKRIQVNNNYITQCGGMMINGGHGLSIRGARSDMHNNTIHNMPSGAQNGTLLDSTMKYNEFYNFGRDITDVGAYYVGMGNNGKVLGVDIEYNFIYDYGPVNPSLGDAVQGIYFDDGHCFSSGRYNILVNGARSAFQIGGGDRNSVEGNIIIGMAGLNLSTDNRRETWTTKDEMYEAGVSGLSSSLISYKHFAKIDPYLNTYLSIPKHYEPVDNVIRNNLSDKPFEINERMEKFGRVYNNKSVEDYSHFVDPENYDYRLKDDSVYAKMIPQLTESNFDLWSVGASPEVTESIDKSFELLFPSKDGEFNSVSDMLTWSKANMVDEYRVLVATDPEMKNIVVDEIAPYNSISVEKYNFEEGKEYWWKVYAINKSFKRKSTWGTEIQKFVNTNNYISAVDTIKFKVNDNKKIMADNDLSFFGEEETKELRAANEKGLKVYQKAVKEGVIGKENYNDIMTTLNVAYNRFEKSEKLVFTHFTPEEFRDKSLWLPSASFEHVPTDNNGVLFKGSRANVMLDKEIGQSNIFQFRAKIDYKHEGVSDGAFASFDLRRKDYKKIGWNDQSVMVIVKRHSIELQFYPKEGLILSVPNKWDLDDKWHEYAIGVVNKAEGVRIIFMIDGEMVIDHRYMNNLAQNDGKFCVFLNGINGIEFEESQYGPLETNSLSLNKFVDGVEHSEEGIWTKSELPGFRGSYVKQIASGSGTASWNFKDLGGKKRIYFRKIAAPDGDKNAKLEIYSDKVWSMGGDEVTYTVPVDMSSGEDEWILLDEGRFQGGLIDIKLVGSGSGTLYANAIRIEEMED